MEAVNDCFLVGHDDSRFGSGMVDKCGEQLLGRVVVWASDHFAEVVHGFYGNQAMCIG